jgi:hypothetical protein
MFGFIFWKVAAVRPAAGMQILALAAGMPCVLWVALSLSAHRLCRHHSGIAPRQAFELTRFDGTPRPRRSLRRWRVLASPASPALSLGMGYRLGLSRRRRPLLARPDHAIRTSRSEKRRTGHPAVEGKQTLAWPALLHSPLCYLQRVYRQFAFSETPSFPRNGHSLLEGTKPAVKVFVATTVMLTFISFWRASAIVLADLASSAYYAGGDAEKVIGKSAPWFILAVMLFSYAVRALYIESSSMFVRGGVYRVVKEAMGGTLAKFSVSALLFDYVLTGPISAVSAGQYLAGFIKDMAPLLFHPSAELFREHFAAGLAVIVVIYFWWKNTQGIHESSQKALQIMIITTVMVVILIVWCTITIYLHRHAAATEPAASRRGSSEQRIAGLAEWNLASAHLTGSSLFVGFGHSVLAMSGEETWRR